MAGLLGLFKMGIFGVSVQTKNKKLENFVNFVNKNLKSNSLVKNPFKGKLTYFDHEGIIVVDLDPIWLNLTPIGVLLIISFYFFIGLTWLMLLSLPFFLLGFCHSSTFQYIVFKKGCRKKGYKDFIKKIKKDSLIRFLTYKSLTKG